MNVTYTLKCKTSTVVSQVSFSYHTHPYDPFGAIQKLLFN